ncbi:YbhB/YbcL family Raf kinase inhibitor-like protein [Patescibacteria group bacterium]|nr:MAG: YbhB/YbcL family Raf kinase inhibitor-like protein [Patescibacteria group bacterium]
MKKFLVVGTLFIIAVAALTAILSTRKESRQASTMSQLKLTSPVFEENGTIPSKYTCDGEDINPPLEISGIPADAKSLALIMDDPDAPRGIWDHWVVFNIRPTTDDQQQKSYRILEGVEPEGIAGNNSWPKKGYGGPCPPSGTHRYFFKLYALDVMLDLPAGSSKGEVESAMRGHILDQIELVGLYARGR